MKSSLPGAHAITIKTDRLLLRPLQIEDAPDVFAIRSHPKVATWNTPHADISQSRHWIQIRLEGERCWSFAVELLPATGGGKVDSALPDEVLQDDLKVVGLCGGQSLPDIGYSFHPSLWGQGYATEAIRGFLEAYWETFPIGFPGLQGDERDYLRARTDARNRASIAVLRKLGFEFWKEEEEDRDGGKDKVLVCIWRLWRPGMVSEMVVRP